MNKKLYVGNLPSIVEEQQLVALFAADGRKVVSVKMPTDKKTGRTRGFAFVEMATQDDAVKAQDALHGHKFLGRALSITEAQGASDSNASQGTPKPRKLSQRWQKIFD